MAVLQQRRDRAEGRDVEAEESDEQAKLDLWHWQDPQLQPQQLLEAEAERKRDYRAAYLLKSKQIVQIEDRQTPVVNIDDRSSSNVSIANTDVPYRKTLSWEVPGYRDVYLVNLNSGRRTRVLEKVRFDASLSPTGKYITWFDAEQKKWFAKKATDDKAKAIEISKGIKHPLYDVLEDRPTLPSAYGTAGWLQGDRALLVYDRYDVWQLDPTGQSKPICVTRGGGRKNGIRFRYRRLDREQRFIDADKPIILTAFHLKTKASGFYSLPALKSKAKVDEDDSPLFFVDKINTPLLILHNDQDGAVPWYQGIELFVALRRLEKPAWMLNYNGDPHWVMGDYNRRDFAIRMQQFFDHYLKDAPEPEWMAEGIPAVEKGENFGLELLEPK